jgi:signal peptidase II
MRVVIVSILIVLSDQAAKLAVKGFNFPFLGLRADGVPYGASYPVLGDFVRLTYIENPGMAFGIDLGGKLFFSLFSILASAGILWYLHRAKDEPFAFRLSLALILGGAVGNLVDRVFYGVIFGEAELFYGRVVDFIDVDFFNVSVFGYSLHRWPVFNIADASVTCGVLLMLFAHRRASRAAGAPAAPAGTEAAAVVAPPSGHDQPGA